MAVGKGKGIGAAKKAKKHAYVAPTVDGRDTVGGDNRTTVGGDERVTK